MKNITKFSSFFGVNKLSIWNNAMNIFPTNKLSVSALWWHILLSRSNITLLITIWIVLSFLDWERRLITSLRAFSQSITLVFDLLCNLIYALTTLISNWLFFWTRLILILVSLLLFSVWASILVDTSILISLLEVISTILLNK